MHTAVRPWVTTGVALVGASVIAVTPVSPPPQALVPQAQVPTVQMPAVRLSASIAEIFAFPAFRQFVINQIDDAVTLGVGLASAGAALGQSIALIPETLRTVTEQVLSGDLLGALTTIEIALVGSVVAVGEPILAAIIERRQRVLAVQQALQLAVPEAFFSVVGGIGQGVDEVLRAFIIAGQGLVDAVLSLSPGAIASALVDGTTLVLGSFVDGGQHVVDGIVSAQQTIATALAAQPAAETAAAFSGNISGTEVTDVPDLSRKSALVAVGPQGETSDTAAVSAEPTSEETAAPSKADTLAADKADKDDSASATKDAEPATADNGADPSPTSPQNEDEKQVDSPKHETAKADNSSESEGAKKK